MSSVCLSVRPSVTLVDCDHIGWNSSKIISRLVSLGCSLSADPNIRGLLQWEHPEILAQSDPPLLIERRRHSIANCGRMVTDGEPIGNHQISFEWCYSWPPTTSPSPKMGFYMPPRYANGHISATAHSIVSRKTHQLWNVIAWSYKDRFWWHLAEICKML